MAVISTKNHFQLLALLLSPCKDSATIERLALAIVDRAFDWRPVVYLSSLHLCSPLLYQRLQSDRLLPLLPEELQEFLTQLFQLNLERNNEFFQALAEVVRRLQAIHIEPVLLKGGAKVDAQNRQGTTSLMIAAALHTQESIELILLGGTVRKDSPDLSGPLTEENLGRFRVNLAVLGADGVSADGVFTESMNVARVSRAIVKAAERAVLTIDGSKFGRAALVRYAEWQDFNQVITDKGVPAQVRKWLNRKGPEVVYA